MRGDGLTDGAKSDNKYIIMKSKRQNLGRAATSTKSFNKLLAEEFVADPSFRAEWQRLAPARKFAAVLIRYRAEHDLNQRQLAKRLGVSQPRIVKLESGEHNPDVSTIINAVRRLGIEFCLDVSPAGRKPALITVRALQDEPIDHDDVSVVAASSA